MTDPTPDALQQAPGLAVHDQITLKHTPEDLDRLHVQILKDLQHERATRRFGRHSWSPTHTQEVIPADFADDLADLADLADDLAKLDRARELRAKCAADLARGLRILKDLPVCPMPLSTAVAAGEALPLGPAFDSLRYERDAELVPPAAKLDRAAEQRSAVRWTKAAQWIGGVPIVAGHVIAAVGGYLLAHAAARVWGVY